MISIYQIKNWFMFPKSPGMIVNRNKTGIVKLVFLFIWISIPALSYSDNNEAGERPNLLIIITDQQRFDALSYAGNTILKTPNMDRIAKEGVWFRNAHTQCAVCAPARASIFTGRTVENTLVIFMSDHGEMMGAHGMRSKNVFYEESSHIPLMMRFPGRIEPGTKVDSYISLVNVFATILDYLEMPEQDSDGFSLRGLIEGTDEKNGKYVGAGSICSTSSKFSDRHGDAKALLAEGIRVAKAVDSPIVGVRIGNIDDRYTEGGIKPKIDEVVKVMKMMRGPALDAGIKFAFENHAGDLRSDELLELINETGTGICGAFYDPGNAIWAMEDPMLALEALGKHIICTSVRDVMVWASEDGAIFQWTAIGDGLMDYKYYARFLSENSPGVPLHVESISNSQRLIPYLKPDFWDGFPDLCAPGIIDFLKLVRLGQPMKITEPPSGADRKTFDIRHQENELFKSLDYLRSECGAGRKNNV